MEGRDFAPCHAVDIIKVGLTSGAIRLSGNRSVPPPKQNAGSAREDATYLRKLYAALTGVVDEK